MTIDRRAARVLVLDVEGRILLFRGGDPARPDDGTWWFTPGGGVEGDETDVEAARRELEEETGFVAARLEGPIHHRETEFLWDGDSIRQSEEYFVTRVEAFAVRDAGWTDLERRSLVESRWWRLEELDTTTDTIFPAELTTLIRKVLQPESA